MYRQNVSLTLTLSTDVQQVCQQAQGRMFNLLMDLPLEPEVRLEAAHWVTHKASKRELDALHVMPPTLCETSLQNELPKQAAAGVHSAVMTRPGIEVIMH